jgi:hypothetical protein
MDEPKENKPEIKKEKKNKETNWIVQTLSIVAGVLLILLICDAAFGNGVFSWLNKTEVKEINPIGYNGLLVGTLTGSAQSLENYEVMYDSTGKLVYELIDDGRKINTGEGYTVIKDGRDARTVIVAIASTNTQQKYLTCGCVGPKCLSSAKDPCTLTGEETFSCEGTYTLGESEGACRFVPKGWI